MERGWQSQDAEIIAVSEHLNSKQQIIQKTTKSQNYSNYLEFDTEYWNGLKERQKCTETLKIRYFIVLPFSY